MKNLVFLLCMFLLSAGAFAQDEAAASNWITGEQESSYPGQTIKYAVCQSTMTLEDGEDPVTVSLNVMIFRGNLNFFLSVKGDLFVVENMENISTQKTLIQFDDAKSNRYPLVGDNNYTASKLSFQSNFKDKFKKGLRTAKKCNIIVELKNAGQQTFEFNVEGLDPEFLQ